MKYNLQVEERTLFHRLDMNLIFVIVALNVIGLINLYSATHGALHAENSNLFWQQIVWLFIGWGIFFSVNWVDYDWYRRISWILYGMNVAALVAVEIVGKVAYGAQRWLDLGFFRYQPSETMKLVLVFVMARILADRAKPEGLGFRELFWPTLVALVPAALIIKQPDLGTGMLLLLIFTAMVLFVRVKRSVLMFLFIIGLVATPLVWSFGLKPYQKNRVLTFMNPGKDARGAGYNSIQSRIAVGSGRIIGKGFRKGTQSQLEFLPERHTDFIYSVLSEEHGFVGSVTTAGLFMILLFMGFRVASQAKDRFGCLLAVGAMSVIFWHVSINISMVIGMLPIVGVPLPLLSYGGSIMITTMACLGIVSSVASRKYLF
jgi:rod shape determining protein RodA